MSDLKFRLFDSEPTPLPDGPEVPVSLPVFICPSCDGIAYDLRQVAFNAQEMGKDVCFQWADGFYQCKALLAELALRNARYGP